MLGSMISPFWVKGGSFTVLRGEVILYCSAVYKFDNYLTFYLAKMSLTVWTDTLE